LVSNRSGVGHYDELGGSNGDFATAVAGSQFFINEPLTYAPGTSYQYSTHGYTVLGAAMEGATGDSIFEIVDQRITEGLNLPTLRPEDLDRADDNRATLYNTDNTEANFDNMSWKVLGGGLESSAYDLVRYGMKLLDGQIISQVSMEELWTVPDPAINSYAHGWLVGTQKGTQSVGKDGNQRGARTYIQMYPEKEIVIVVLSNRDEGGHSARKVAQDIGSLMLDNLRPEPLAGDFNLDRTVNATDIDQIFAAIRGASRDRKFDLTGDGGIGKPDVDYLVHEILKTNYGDANLDRVFNSSDLVQVFRFGEYEDRGRGNSTWEEGDWNGDGEFDSADIVAAFRDGAYVAAASPDPLSFDPSSEDLRKARRRVDRIGLAADDAIFSV
jgi:hypothetical protein